MTNIEQKRKARRERATKAKDKCMAEIKILFDKPTEIEKKKAERTARGQEFWENHLKSVNFSMPEHIEREQRERAIKQWIENKGA